MGFAYILKVPILPSPCGFFFAFGCRISVFGSFQLLVLIVVFVRGGELKSFYPTILKESLSSLFHGHILSFLKVLIFSCSV